MSDHAPMPGDPNMGLTPELGGQSIPQIVATNNIADPSFMDRAARFARQTAVTLEMGPANGVVRYGAAAAVEVATGNGLMSAATLALTTLAVEGGGGYATADLLADENPGKVIDYAGRLLDKFMPPKVPLTLERQVVVANYLGTGALVLARNSRDPSRTREANRSYALRTASWLAGGCAVQGALVFEGVIDDPTDVTRSGPAAAVLLTAAWGIRKLKNRSQQTSVEETL